MYNIEVKHPRVTHIRSAGSKRSVRPWSSTHTGSRLTKGESGLLWLSIEAICGKKPVKDVKVSIFNVEQVVHCRQ